MQPNTHYIPSLDAEALTPVTAGQRVSRALMTTKPRSSELVHAFVRRVLRAERVSGDAFFALLKVMNAHDIRACDPATDIRRKLFELTK